jgi:hypothetical protein
MIKDQLNLFETLDMSNANEIVLVANTPSYLLDRLRKDASVAHIAQTMPTSEILSELRISSAIDPQRVQDVVQRYVYIAALAMKDPSEIWPSFGGIDLQKLEWGDQLREIIKAENVATNRIVTGAPTGGANRGVEQVEATNGRTNQLIQRDPGQGTIIV